MGGCRPAPGGRVSDGAARKNACRLSHSSEPARPVHAPGGRALPLNRGGEVVAALPLDYVVWSERLEAAAREVARPGDTPASGRQFWISGRFSPLARSKLRLRAGPCTSRQATCFGWIERSRAASRSSCTYEQSKAGANGAAPVATDEHALGDAGRVVRRRQMLPLTLACDSSISPQGAPQGICLSR
jgi:hypothetical protein